MFEVGQKCVCIGDNWEEGLFPEKVPKKDVIYTVREVLLVNGVECIRLHEIRNQPKPYPSGLLECCFHGEAFRPLTDSELQAEHRAVIDRHFSQHLDEPVREPQTVE